MRNTFYKDTSQEKISGAFGSFMNNSMVTDQQRMRATSYLNRRENKKNAVKLGTLIQM